MTQRLTARSTGAERTIVTVGTAGGRPGTTRVEIGGRGLVVIAGPCAVEGRDMLLGAARAVSAAGAAVLRGGAFKPRTSPYAFQGLGFDGLELLAEAREATGMPVVTEVLDPRHVERVAATADMLQIGARNMQNYALLAEVGRTRVPVLLKRGLSATIDELLLAAEHVMAQGNGDVVLCERGIRTFEHRTRNPLDVAAVPVLKAETHLPVIIDPSHAGGRAALVAPLAFAAVAAGADGLIIEVHPDPAHARSDGDQSLTPEAFTDLMHRLTLFAAAADRALGRPGEPPAGSALPPAGQGRGDARDARDVRALLTELARVRDAIGAIDRELVTLLARRVGLAQEAGRAKHAAGLPVLDAAQERVVLGRARDLAHDTGLSPVELYEIMRRVIALSRHAQEPDAAPPRLTVVP